MLVVIGTCGSGGKEPEEDRQAHLNYPKLAGQLLLTFRCLSGVSSPLRPAKAFASGICPQWLRRLSLSHCWDRHSQMDRLPVELGSLVLVDHQGLVFPEPFANAIESMMLTLTMMLHGP